MSCQEKTNTSSGEKILSGEAYQAEEYILYDQDGYSIGTVIYKGGHEYMTNSSRGGIIHTESCIEHHHLTAEARIEKLKQQN